MKPTSSKQNPAKAGPVRQATQAANRTAHNPGVIFLGRLGYAAKGVVYVVIGILAAFAALGNGGATTDRKGAVQAIYDQPFGKILLGLVTFGLLCYALWSFVRAIADTDKKGTEPKGLATRLFYGAVGVSYFLFAFGAFQLLMGSGNTGKSSDTSTQDWTAELLKQPLGIVLVIIAGLVVLGVAGYEFYKAYKADFKKHLEMGQMNAQTREWIVRFGQFGLAARGIVFTVIGIFLIVAALHQDPNQAKGLGGALQELSQQPYGQVLLGIVAVGLAAYGIYSLAEARYRRMIETTTTSKN
jgi:uncharacterized membrane protein YidH (DUF202 family)